jgi:hypothetical protein
MGAVSNSQSTFVNVLFHHSCAGNVDIAVLAAESHQDHLQPNTGAIVVPMR